MTRAKVYASRVGRARRYARAGSESARTRRVMLQTAAIVKNNRWTQA
jgi:hypothetical protein